MGTKSIANSLRCNYLGKYIHKNFVEIWKQRNKDSHAREHRQQRNNQMSMNHSNTYIITYKFVIG